MSIESDISSRKMVTLMTKLSTMKGVVPPEDVDNDLGIEGHYIIVKDTSNDVTTFYVALPKNIQ